MPIYYPSNCKSDIVAHVCSDCPEVEHGRIRSVAFIHKDVAFVDPTSAAEWQAIIAANPKDIIVIPETHGTFDGGSPQYGLGYGNEEERFLGSEYILAYFDPNYKDNYPFYQSIKTNGDYKVAYATETLVHIVDAQVRVNPKAPVEDEMNSEVVWSVEVKWKSKNDPEPFDIPATIFACFAIT